MKLPAADLDGDLYVQDHRARRMREITPARPAWQEGRYMPKTPCLLARADDRNGLATPIARGCNSIAADATPARSIGLVSPATVNGAPLSETKVKADLALRFSVHSARKSILEQSETYICLDCREFRHSDQIIKFEHGGTDRRYFWRETPPFYLCATPPPVQRGGRVGMLQTPCLFAPADDRNALATRAQLLWPANARCNGATVRPSRKRK